MKRVHEYDGKNPLAKYYCNLVKENQNKRVNNWRIIADSTGIPVQTAISVARKDEEGVQNMLVSTYFKIKDTIGVDMLSFKK